jgi:hypothetical protein
MDQKQFIKQMLDFQKTTFDNSFNAMVMLQEQTEKASKTLLDQMTWLPNDSRKANDQWVAAYKKGCKDFKALVDENFSKAEAFFCWWCKHPQNQNQESRHSKRSHLKKIQLGLASICAKPNTLNTK